MHSTAITVPPRRLPLLVSAAAHAGRLGALALATALRELSSRAGIVLGRDPVAVEIPIDLLAPDLRALLRAMGKV